MSEEVFALLGREQIEKVAKGVVERRDGPFRRRTQFRFQFAEDILNGIEIRAVGGK